LPQTGPDPPMHGSSFSTLTANTPERSVISLIRSECSAFHLWMATFANSLCRLDVEQQRVVVVCSGSAWSPATTASASSKGFAGGSGYPRANIVQSCTALPLLRVTSLSNGCTGCVWLFRIPRLPELWGMIRNTGTDATRYEAETDGDLKAKLSDLAALAERTAASRYWKSETKKDTETSARPMCLQCWAALRLFLQRYHQMPVQSHQARMLLCRLTSPRWQTTWSSLPVTLRQATSYSLWLRLRCEFA